MDVKRALLVTRLSALTDESTSPKRQKDQTSAAAKARGSVVVGHAEDLDISAGKYTPWERPQLGPWLSERADEFDEIIVWRLDRLVRSVYDLSVFVKWCEDNGKTLVSATEPFDLGTPLGRILVVLLAAFAEMELNAIKERVLSSHAELRTTNRWAGGPSPYGYMTVPNTEVGDDGRIEGKILVPDAEVIGTVNSLLSDAEIGKSPNSLQIELNKALLSRVDSEMQDILNRQGQLSPEEQQKLAELAPLLPPTERQRQLQGKPLGKKDEDGLVSLTRWSRQSVINILRNQALLGFKMRDVYAPSPKAKNGVKVIGREPVRDASGMPVRCASAIVDEQQFWTVQLVLGSRGFTRTRTNGASMLLDVVYCDKPCSEKWHIAHTAVRGKPYNYYRCSSKNQNKVNCGAKSYRAEWLESFVAEQFLNVAGSIEVTRSIYIPGSTHQADMDEIRSAMEFLTDQQLSAGPLQREIIQQKMAAHEARYAELAALPLVEPHWETQGLGVTFGELWSEAWDRKHAHEVGRCHDAQGKDCSAADCAMTDADRDPDTEELRSLLLRSGIRFTINRPQGTIKMTYGDIKQGLTSIADAEYWWSENDPALIIPSV